jgi:hypothetical protein
MAANGSSASSGKPVFKTVADWWMASAFNGGLL